MIYAFQSTPDFQIVLHRTNYWFLTTDIEISSFNSHSLQIESSVFDSNGRWNTLSTRTHYRMTPITIDLTKNMTVSFQLALTTECIISLRSHGRWHWSFNSHSLRSVSGKSSAFPIVLILSTRTHYGVYHKIVLIFLFKFPFQLALTTECIVK